MAVTSHLANDDLQKQNAELTTTVSELQKEITALKKAQFKQDILLKKHETSIKEQGGHIAHYLLYIKNQDGRISREEGSQSMVIGMNGDSTGVNCTGGAWTEQTAQEPKIVISRDVSKQSNKDNDKDLLSAGKSKRISSMLPDSPAFVPSGTTIPPTQARANSSVFLPSLSDSIFASMPSPTQPSRSVKTLSHASSTQSEYSPILHTGRGASQSSRPMLISWVNQFTNLDVGSSTHVSLPSSFFPIVNAQGHPTSTRPPFLRPDRPIERSLTSSEGAAGTRNAQAWGLVPIGKVEQHPASTQLPSLEVVHSIKGPSAAEAFGKLTGEVLREEYGPLVPVVLPKEENGRTPTAVPAYDSLSPRFDPYASLSLLDSSLESADGSEHGRSSPIKQEALTPSKLGHVSTKSTHFLYGSDSYKELNTARVLERLKLHLQRTTGIEELVTKKLPAEETVTNESIADEPAGEDAIPDEPITEEAIAMACRPQALKPNFTRVIGSALDSESRALVLKRSSSVPNHPRMATGRHQLDLKSSRHVFVKLELPSGKVMSVGDLVGSVKENVKLRLHLLLDKNGATSLELAARIFPAGTDLLMLTAPQDLPWLIFKTKFNLPGHLEAENITLKTLAAKSGSSPQLSPEIETLRDPGSKELMRTVHCISFAYSGNDFEISKPNPLSPKDYTNHSQWDAETLRFFEFLPVLQDPSPKKLTITFMDDGEENADAIVSEIFRAIHRKISLARRTSWDDGCGLTWEAIEDAEGDRKWRVKALETFHDANEF